jgi:hypothetical protein
MGRLVEDARGPVVDRSGYLSAVEVGAKNKRLGLGAGFFKLWDEVCPVAIWQPQVYDRHIHRLCPEHASRLR